MNLPSQPLGEDSSTTYLFRNFAESQDPLALEALVKRIEPMLFAQASRRIGSQLRARFDPEDVSQSVLLVFVRKMESGQIQWQGSLQLRSLLCKMVCQKVREYVRRHTALKRDVSKDVSLQGAAAPTIEPLVTDAEVESFATEELHQRIAQLFHHFKHKPTHLKVLPRTIAGEEKSLIANDLDISKKRVEQIIAEAERFVRECMTDS